MIFFRIETCYATDHSSQSTSDSNINLNCDQFSREMLSKELVWISENIPCSNHTIYHKYNPEIILQSLISQLQIMGSSNPTLL